MEFTTSKEEFTVYQMSIEEVSVNKKEVTTADIEIIIIS